MCVFVDGPMHERLLGFVSMVFPNQTLQHRSANKDQQVFEGEIHHSEEPAYYLDIVLGNNWLLAP